MSTTSAMPAPPSSDKRWKLVDATIRRHGRAGQSLIECLHTMQECFGYLDEQGLRYIAAALQLPLSKVYGVATFYNLFSLKPQGEHTAVICMGTACYIKGAPLILAALEEKYGVKPGETTKDGKLSVLTARCIGSCGLAPALVFDGDVAGKAVVTDVLKRVEKWMAA
jgi:bidirectional [NiFe] hydrogenase diaphorase subunit